MSRFFAFIPCNFGYLMVLYLVVSGVKMMEDKLKGLYDALLSLQTDEEMNNLAIKSLEDEFNNYISSQTTDEKYIEGIFLGSFASNLRTLDKKKAILDTQKRKLPGYIIVLAIALPMIPLSLFISLPLFNPITVLFLLYIAIMFKRKSITEFIYAYVDYKNIKKHIEKLNTKEEYQKLIDMKKNLNDLQNEKKKNHDKLENIKRKFIKTLEEEMQEKYKELGIDEKVIIESASLTDGSSAGITLDLKAPKDILD